MSRYIAALTGIALLAAACTSTGAETDTLTVYSGRSEELVAPLMAEFEEQTGVSVSVRYAGSAELAATIMEGRWQQPGRRLLRSGPGVTRRGGTRRAVRRDPNRSPRPCGRNDSPMSRGGGSECPDGPGRWSTTAAKSPPRNSLRPKTGFAQGSWAGRNAIAPTNGSFPRLRGGEDLDRRRSRDARLAESDGRQRPAQLPG